MSWGASENPMIVGASIDAKRGMLDRAESRFEELLRRGDRGVVEPISISMVRVELKVGATAFALRHLRQVIAIDPACGRYVAETPAFAPYRAAISTVLAPNQ